MIDKMRVAGFVGEIVTLVSSIVTLISAVWTYRSLLESRANAKKSSADALEQRGLLNNQKQQMENQEKQAVQILESLSTRFRGTFPDYLPQIAEIIRRSEKRLLIMGAIPAHGAYSRSAEWKRIQKAIQEKLEEQEDKPGDKSKLFQAVVICGDLNCRKLNYENIYGWFSKDLSKWKVWREENAYQLSQFIKLFPQSILCRKSIDDVTVKELIEHRLNYDDYVIENVFVHFKKFESKESLPFFCWISDDEAVFSFKTENPEGTYTGAGIYTREAAFVETLVTSFEYYLGRSLQVGTDPC